MSRRDDIAERVRQLWQTHETITLFEDGLYRHYSANPRNTRRTPMIDLPQEAIDAAVSKVGNHTTTDFAPVPARGHASEGGTICAECGWLLRPALRAFGVDQRGHMETVTVAALTAALPTIEAAIRDEIEREALELRPSEPITSLDGLTARDVACLARDGIRTISELTAKTPEYLHSIRNLGKIGANRIETALAARGLSLTGHASLEARLREQIAQEIEVEMRYHDHQQIGFSAIGDAYAHAARIAREGGRK